MFLVAKSVQVELWEEAFPLDPVPAATFDPVHATDEVDIVMLAVFAETASFGFMCILGDMSMRRRRHKFNMNVITIAATKNDI